MLDTVYSLSADVPPSDGFEEDSGAIFQPGSLTLGSIRQVCQIRKIAAGGAVLHADLAIEVGRRLGLELETGEHLDGTIAWREGFEIGLRFDRPIDILPILARNLAGQPGERRRMPRIEVCCAGLLEAAGRTELITVRDIAQGGAKVETPFNLAREDRVVVTPEGLHPIAGVVRWVRDGVAGVAFDQDLGWQELMPWLRERRQAPPADFAAPPAAVDAAAPPAADPEGSVQLNLQARVREGLHRWAIDVDTLTQRSIEFESYAPLRLGTLLWIVLPGLEGWPARIVANEGYRFTCEFTQPLHPAVLERVLAAARDGA